MTFKKKLLPGIWSSQQTPFNQGTEWQDKRSLHLFCRLMWPINVHLYVVRAMREKCSIKIRFPFFSPRKLLTQLTMWRLQAEIALTAYLKRHFQTLYSCMMIRYVREGEQGYHVCECEKVFSRKGEWRSEQRPKNNWKKMYGWKRMQRGMYAWLKWYFFSLPRRFGTRGLSCVSVEFIFLKQKPLASI